MYTTHECTHCTQQLITSTPFHVSFVTPSLVRCQPRRNAIPRVSVGAVNGQQQVTTDAGQPVAMDTASLEPLGTASSSTATSSRLIRCAADDLDGDLDEDRGGEDGDDEANLRGARHGRLIFCKHVFKRRGPVIGQQDMSHDPSECHLLYVQALHSVIQVVI